MTAIQDAVYEDSRIDWARCRRRLISCNDASLPPNITSMHAGILNGSSLRDALSYCKDPVQVVQIETPFSERGKNAARQFAQAMKGNLGFHPNPPLHPVISYTTADFSQSPGILGRMIDQALSDWVIPVDYQARRDLGVRYMSMIHALIDVGAKISLSKIFVDSVSRRDVPSFHDHIVENGKAGWYLTAPLGDDSTLFADSRQTRIHNITRARFTTPSPDLWQGKPWSCFLFTAGNHPHGNALHSVPESAMRRATITVGFTL